MIRLRIYTDTSVIGGCFDDEFKEYSNRLFDGFVSGSMVAVISAITLNELIEAPAKVRVKLDSIPRDNIEHVLLTKEAGELARKYIESGVFSNNQLIDAQHIAIATVERVDVVVSWNFKHIVNLTNIHGVNSVNIREGYPLLEIRTPREVIGEEEGV